jgi:hypothetical protein
MLSLSLLQVRTLLPRGRVMTSNRARHELIQLPTIMKVRLLGTRRQSGTRTVPGTSPIWPGTPGVRDGDAPPPPSPICPESGTLPRPRPLFGGDGSRRSPVPGSHRGPGVRALTVSELPSAAFDTRLLPLPGPSHPGSEPSFPIDSAANGNRRGPGAAHPPPPPGPPPTGSNVALD